MPSVNHGKKEVLLKLVYYGPGLGGKTTNLEWIHEHSSPEHRGKLLSLTNETERTLFFDLLPVALGTFRGYSVRLHLCTVPGQVRYDKTRRLILRHVDGVVFVVDSQPMAIEANVEALHNLAVNLRLQGDDPDRVPVVVQYNKRDLPDALPVRELSGWLGVPRGVTCLEASAINGRGVLETLKTIVTQCMKLVGDPKQAKQGRTPSILPGRRESMYPAAIPPTVRSRPPPEREQLVLPQVPSAPRVPSVTDLDDE